MTDRIVTERLILRKAGYADTESIWNRVWRDGDAAKYMLWRTTDSLPEALERMKRTIAFQTDRYAFFVCLKETDEAIGFCGVRESEKGLAEETGICIAKEYRGRGFGREVLRALVTLAFDEMGCERFLYSCFHENIPSAALCKGCGFAYLDSRECVREWDGLKYQSDRYILYKKDFI